MAMTVNWEGLTLVRKRDPVFCSMGFIRIFFPMGVSMIAFSCDGVMLQWCEDFGEEGLEDYVDFDAIGCGFGL